MSTKEQPRSLDLSLFYVEDTSAEERTTHSAACHCCAVKYEVTLKYPFPKYPVNRCSCSICTGNGYLFVYPCRRDVVFTQGYDNLSSYEFNTKKRTHKFCKTCGSSILIDFGKTLPEGKEVDPRKDILAINVRHFINIDLDAMEYTFFDGKKKIPRVDRL